MQTQGKHGGAHSRCDAGKSFEWLSGLGGGRASPAQSKAAAVGRAGSREGNGARRGLVKRSNTSHLHQQGDCTMCWEKAGIAPLPKQVPQPNEVYVQEENCVMSLCGRLFRTEKVILKVKENTWKIHQNDC